MSLIRNHPVKNIREKVAQVLEETYGEPFQIDEGAILGGRDHIRRFQIQAGSLPLGATQFVVKEAQLWDGEVYDPNALEGPSVQLFDDWAALQFLAQVVTEHRISPRSYGGNRDEGFILLEDLAGTDPIDILQGNDPTQANDLLVAQSRTLACMHGATIHRQHELEEFRGSLGQRGGEKDIHGYFYGYEWIYSALQPALESLGIVADSGLQVDLIELTDLLAQPGPFLTFTHGDPCPDNFIYRDGRVYIIDFERSLYRHALIDAVYGRMANPSCWCACQVPEEVALSMESGYRTELAKWIPATNDDSRFFYGVVAACAYWTLIMFQRYDVPALVKSDSQWGMATLRQRLITRSRTFVALTGQYGCYQALGATIGRIIENLEKRWRHEDLELPMFPAFSKA